MHHVCTVTYISERKKLTWMKKDEGMHLEKNVCQSTNRTGLVFKNNIQVINAELIVKALIH